MQIRNILVHPRENFSIDLKKKKNLTLPTKHVEKELETPEYLCIIVYVPF